MNTNVGDIVSGCASLAALLEVSAYPKPGNIHRLRDFPETKYEHFLAGSVSLGPKMKELADKGQELKWAELGLGESILGSVMDMLSWQSGGNVHLGVILLLSPLAAAAGSVMKDGVVDIDELRGSLRDIISGSTPSDAVNIYRAIDLAMSESNLGIVDRLDVKDDSSLDTILEEGLTPRDIFNECGEKDDICSEWITGFEITFTEGYPYLRKKIDEGSSINEATVDTFLKILSEHPDSLIKRKKKVEEAVRVSEKAKRIIQAGGTSTENGMKMIRELDDELRKDDGAYNPGTSADLTAASLFLLLLTGWRP